MPRITTIALDADDTLWHNENIFENVHARYRELLADYHDAATVDRTLFATEIRNLELYGYGVKGFTLSAIETAIELSGGRIGAAEIRRLIALGREMLEHPVDLLDGVAETLAALAPRHRLILITKGDLRDQERAQAGGSRSPGWAEFASVPLPCARGRHAATSDRSQAPTPPESWGIRGGVGGATGGGRPPASQRLRPWDDIRRTWSGAPWSRPS